jgi:carbonic anhydrase
LNDFKCTSLKGEFEAVVNIKTTLPSDLAYYTYKGSLITPPCSEIITWIVLKSTVRISQAQYDAFTDIFDGNYRPTQPFNSRTIKG